MEIKELGTQNFEALFETVWAIPSGFSAFRSTQDSKNFRRPRAKSSKICFARTTYDIASILKHNNVYNYTGILILPPPETGDLLRIFLSFGAQKKGGGN